jgi:hypothetical protein
MHPKWRAVDVGRMERSYNTPGLWSSVAQPHALAADVLMPRILFMFMMLCASTIINLDSLL